MIELGLEEGDVCLATYRLEVLAQSNSFCLCRCLSRVSLLLGVCWLRAVELSLQSVSLSVSVIRRCAQASCRKPSGVIARAAHGGGRGWGAVKTVS